MVLRVVEEVVRSGRTGHSIRLRIDLHGVSCFGPGDHRTLIRWEWIESITPDCRGVTIVSGTDQILLPSGAFGLEPEALAGQLDRAGSIFARAEVLDQLSSAPPSS